MPAVWLSWAASNLLCGRDLCHLAPNWASRASLLGTTCVADTCPPRNRLQLLHPLWAI